LEWVLRFVEAEHTFLKVPPSPPGLPDIYGYNIPKREKIYVPNYYKIYQMVAKIPNGRKIDQMTIKCTNIFHGKTLLNLPKVGLLVSKYTIWQAWPPPGSVFRNL
jgi:hypothetical protein